MRLTIRPFRCRRVFYPLFIAIIVVFVLYFQHYERSIEPHINATLPIKGQYQLSKPVIRPLDHREPVQLVTPRLVTPSEIRGGRPEDPAVAQKRDVVREMMKHAWHSYAKHAWGANELRPISQSPHQPEVLGSHRLGATIVDAIDTLYMMSLDEEFQTAREWIKTELNFDKPGFVSVFEFTIRFIGGLLSTYTFTQDKIFLDKAVELADRLLPAFDSPSGLPYSLVNLKTGARHNFGWATGRCCILSEVGTLHMEFAYLSELSGNPVYSAKVHRIRSVLSSLPRPQTLFYNFINPVNQQWCSNTASIGGLADSFYEYLLKEWLRSGRRDSISRKLYDEAIESLRNKSLFRYSAKNNLYVADYSNGVVSSRMEHLACFAGGLFALGSTGSNDMWFDIGANLTSTCRLSYASSTTKLGPDAFQFSDTVEAIAGSSRDRVYLLRPETFESYFYLWRFTKNQKYRDWAWEAVQALEKYTHTPNGFSGLRDVYADPPNHDDVQQSFFLAETLKYLYLIFSDDSLLPLDRWVFNTEAHPFPVQTTVFLKDNVWPKIPN